MSSPSAHSVEPDHAIPSVPVDDILGPLAPSIQRLRLCFGLPTEEFDHRVLPVLKRYAAYVHLLPATRDQHHRQQGGLLKLGMDVAFYSLQGTDGHIFEGRSTISVRRHLEPRWRMATFIAGLCCGVHAAIGQLTVTDLQGKTWPRLVLPLADWLVSSRSQHYRPSWHLDTSEPFSSSRLLGIFALPLIVPADTLAFLSEDNVDILPAMLSGVGGCASRPAASPLARLVRRSFALVVGEEARAQLRHSGPHPPGCPLPVRDELLDTLAELLSSDPRWRPNVAKGRAWWGIDGLFLLWPQALDDLLSCLACEPLPGMPQDRASLLQTLVQAHLLELHPDGSPRWTIQPPESRSAQEAVKVTCADQLLSGLCPHLAPLQTRLTHPAASVVQDQEPMVSSSRPACAPVQPERAADEQRQMERCEGPDGLQGSRAPALEPLAPRIAQPAVPSEQPTAAVPPIVPDAAAHRPRFRLKLPMRLDPAIRQALTRISLLQSESDTTPGSTPDPEGLFVPMSALRQHGIDPAMARRALTEAGLLAHRQTDPPPVARGTPPGLWLLPSCVERLDLREPAGPTRPSLP